MGYCHLKPRHSGTTWQHRPESFGPHKLDPEFDQEYVAVYADEDTKIAYVCMRGDGQPGTSLAA